MKTTKWHSALVTYCSRKLQSLATFLTRWRLLPSGLYFRWQLARLFAKQDQIRRIYNRYLDEAKREKRTPEEIEQIVDEAQMEESIVVDDIESLVTRFWLRRAQRLFVPTPHRSDSTMWKERSFTRSKVLTELGITVIRKAVREEENAGRDSWAQIAALLIGAIGAITGLLAVFLSK